MLKVEEYNTVVELNKRLNDIADHKVTNIIPVRIQGSAPMYVLVLNNND